MPLGWSIEADVPSHIARLRYGESTLGQRAHMSGPRPRVQAPLCPRRRRCTPYSRAPNTVGTGKVRVTATSLMLEVYFPPQRQSCGYRRLPIFGSAIELLPRSGGGHLVNGFHADDPLAKSLGRQTFCALALCLAWAKEQDGLRVTNSRDHVVVISGEMAGELSVTRVFCQTIFRLIAARKPHVLLHARLDSPIRAAAITSSPKISPIPRTLCWT